MYKPRAALVDFAKRWLPGIFWPLKAARLRSLRPEIELELLSILCDASRATIDVGAADGVYSLHMAALSRLCIAFEPRPQAVRQLRALARYSRLPIQVEPVALSRTPGHTTLRLLESSPERSTIEPSNQLQSQTTTSDATALVINTTTLDAFANTYQIGFIKIDVEGHELGVLEGGTKVLAEHRPIVMIEAENRHCENSVSNVSRFMTAMHYTVHFVDRRTLRPFIEFDEAVHQNLESIVTPNGNYIGREEYINNFICIPCERSDSVCELLRARLGAIAAGCQRA